MEGPDNFAEDYFVGGRDAIEGATLRYARNTRGG